MRFFKRRGGGSSDNEAPVGVDEGADHELPIAGFDKLKGKDLTDRFRELSQAQLAELEEHERSHGQRQDVLAKLRYLRGSQPLPNYDDLDPAEIAAALEGADAETVKAVRDYENRFAQRKEVLQETARVLPGAEPSKRERDAQAEKDARVRSKMRPR
jgi:hypothetical protein